MLSGNDSSTIRNPFEKLLKDPEKYEKDASRTLQIRNCCVEEGSCISIEMPTTLHPDVEQT